MRRVLVSLMAVILSFSVLSMAASAVLFGVIFAREDGASAPAELRYSDIDGEKYPRQTVEFPSGGNLLRGYVYPAAEARGLVLIAGGIRSDADRHLSEIQYFVDHGWWVMAFSGTGVHESQGSGLRGLPQTRLDLTAAVAYIRADPALSALPLVLYGHSVGGYAAVTCLPDAPEVAAAVCIAAFDSPTRLMLAQARQYVGLLADVEYPFLCLQNYFLFGAAADDSALAAINAAGIPIAIFEGASDSVVPEALGLEVHQAEITNPNVTCTLVDAPYRDGHSTIWLSESAARYLAEHGEDPSPDRFRANELDPEFMETVLRFFESAVS